MIKRTLDRTRIPSGRAWSPWSACISSDDERNETAYVSAVISLRFVGVVVMATLAAVWQQSVAQEKMNEKRQPESRRLEFQSALKDSAAPSRQTPMPKIDLPDFVITGNASIDLPNVEKEIVQEEGVTKALVTCSSVEHVRGRETVEVAVGSKEAIDSTAVARHTGKAIAGMGMFSSPQAGVWFGQDLGYAHYSLAGRYFLSKGFASNTDRSGGSFSFGGGTLTESAIWMLNHAHLDGRFDYASNSYKWYGARNPSGGRTLESFAAAFTLTNWSNTTVPFFSEFEFKDLVVTDTTSSVTESQLDLGTTTKFSVASVPLTAGLKVALTSLTGSISASLPFADGFLGSQRYVWDRISLEGSIHLYLASGMEDQHLFHVYPHLDVAFQINPMHSARFAYRPEVEAGTLTSRLQNHRYLSAISNQKHEDMQQNLALLIESCWSPKMSTRVSMEWQSSVDQPLYSDTTSPGVWSFLYGGRTTKASFSAEIFAKFLANDYFASKVLVNLTRNSITGGEVPYTPLVDLSGSYARSFTEQLTVTSTLALIVQRKDKVVNASTLGNVVLLGVRGEYQALNQVSLFLDVQNLLNRKYEFWKGYQETPLILSAGLSFHW